MKVEAGGNQTSLFRTCLASKEFRRALYRGVWTLNYSLRVAVQPD